MSAPPVEDLRRVSCTLILRGKYISLTRSYLSIVNRRYLACLDGDARVYIATSVSDSIVDNSFPSCASLSLNYMH